MAGSRYNLVPKGYWDYLGPAYRGLDADVEELEVAVAAGGSSGPIGPASMQTSLGLSTGSGTTTVTTRALSGAAVSWEDGSDTVPFVLGTRFTANADGTIPSLRFYLTTRQYDGETVTVGLYSDDGAQLGTGTEAITSATSIGWVDVPLTSTVTVTEGTVLRAAMHCPLGNDNLSHYAQTYAGWSSYSSTGIVLASSTGGNGWYAYNAATIRNPDTASGDANAYGIDVNYVTQQASTNTGARLPVVAYYDDSNAATVARPTSDPLAAVLWFNSTGTVYPANALPVVDKVWTL